MHDRRSLCRAGNRYLLCKPMKEPKGREGGRDKGMSIEIKEYEVY